MMPILLKDDALKFMFCVSLRMESSDIVATLESVRPDILITGVGDVMFKRETVFMFDSMRLLRSTSVVIFDNATSEPKVTTPESLRIVFVDMVFIFDNVLSVKLILEASDVIAATDREATLDSVRAVKLMLDASDVILATDIV